MFLPLKRTQRRLYGRKGSNLRCITRSSESVLPGKDDEAIVKRYISRFRRGPGCL